MHGFGKKMDSVWYLFCFAFLAALSLRLISLTHSAALRVLFFCFSRHNLLHLEVYRMQDVETQCNIKSETKLRNEKDFPSILLLWHRGSFQLELSLGTALSPVLTAAAAAQQSKMGKTR